jgi:DNA (cytosine-5)-methyltransferase 1
MMIHNVYGGFGEKKFREFRDFSPTLRTPKGGGHLPMVVQPVLTPDLPEKRQHGRRFKEDGEPSFTLTGQDIHGVMTVANTVTPDAYLTRGERKRVDGKAVLTSMHERRIRRLTPVECERLQGFPDGWTSGASDTQRYKMMGNAVTVSVVEAIGRKVLSLMNNKEE